MMKVDMRNRNHLWVIFDGAESEECRQVIVDKKKNDVRICDGSHVVNVVFDGSKLAMVIVDDVIVSGYENVAVN